MRPILIEFGGIALPSYGVMLVISFVCAILYVRNTAKKFNISPVTIENLAFYLMVGVIIGGRLLYVLFHWHQYENDFLGIIRIWEGGMMFFGGFIGAILGGLIYLKKQKIPVLKRRDENIGAFGVVQRIHRGTEHPRVAWSRACPADQGRILAPRQVVCIRHAIL